MKTLQLTPEQLAWLIVELDNSYEMEYSERDADDEDRLICESVQQALKNAK